jgi:arylformamidase
MPADSTRIFLDYTQEQLDQAYDQLYWAPQRDAIQLEIRRSCEAVRRSMPPRTERYGRSDVQLLDIFARKASSPVPVVVYLHGGAWLRGSRLDCAYPAPAVTGRGAALVVPEFDNVGAISLPAMVEQCREAVDWTVRNAESFGGDPGRVYLAGHSSGAHLASCVLLDSTTVQGALLISGMYDLHAPLLSARSRYVKITPGNWRPPARCAISAASGAPWPSSGRPATVRSSAGRGRCSPRLCRAWASWPVAARSSRPTTSRSRGSSRIPTASSAACCSH